MKISFQAIALFAGIVFAQTALSLPVDVSSSVSARHDSSTRIEARAGDDAAPPNAPDANEDATETPNAQFVKAQQEAYKAQQLHGQTAQEREDELARMKDAWDRTKMMAVWKDAKKENPDGKSRTDLIWDQKLKAKKTEGSTRRSETGV